jgi:phosphatidylserine/phosphatidylglycerophosphate/cardiolipin synthase-like enzyme
MSIARDLTDLEAMLRGRPDIDLFGPAEETSLQSVPEATAVRARIATAIPADPTAIMRLCLQSLRVQHAELSPRLLEAELVATLPPEMPGIARPTEHVVREMLAAPVKEIILLGYEFSDRSILRMLAESAARGSDIIIICDRGRGSAGRIFDEWPEAAKRPRIFHDRERPHGAPYAAMHAKCLLVDGTDLLITSANFTFHGLRGNIEIGVRLTGAPASEARKIFSHLVEKRIVEPLHSDLSH